MPLPSGFTLGKASPFGSIHFELGHWVVGDVVIDDIITKIMGGKGGRLSGIVHLVVEVLPSEITSGDTGLGGPFEPSEPMARP